MLFEQWLNNKVKLIDNYLENIIEIKDNPQKLIYEAMNYSLLSGGKRLRPVLLLASYEIFSDDEEKVLPFACAMEMIHTYSLIHDDLPAMDNDDYRRGRLSNHKLYGEAAAILAGDALLNKAFEISLETIVTGIDIKKAAEAMRIISKSSGTEGMIGGQIVDMLGNKDHISLENLKYMYSLKTGAIITSSVVAGAVLGGANDEEINLLKTYAENVGLAFQIEDDILDVTGKQEKTGKAAGSDSANSKITYLSFVDLKEAKNHVQKYTLEAIKNLNIFGNKAYHLTELADYLTNRDH